MNYELAVSTANNFDPQTIGLALAPTDAQVAFAAAAGFMSEVWAPGLAPHLINALTQTPQLTATSKDHISGFHQSPRGETWRDPIKQGLKGNLSGVIWTTSALAFLAEPEASLEWIAQQQQELLLDVPVVIYEFPDIDSRPEFHHTEIQLTPEALKVWPQVTDPLQFVEQAQQKQNTQNICLDLAHLDRIVLSHGWSRDATIKAVGDQATSLHGSVGRTDLAQLDPQEQIAYVRDLIHYPTTNRTTTDILDQLRFIRDHTNVRRIVLETRPQSIQTAMEVDRLDPSHLAYAYQQIRESFFYVFKS